MIKRLLVIPSRSGSTRIKNKNMKFFFKKPIIEYGLNQAIKSKLFTTIHVSTNSLRQIKYLSKYRTLDNFLRPNKLSKDQIPIVEVMKYVLESFKKKNQLFDEIWMLLPCSPLIDKHDLIRGSKILKANKAFTTVSANRIPIQWTYEIKKNKLNPFFPNFFKKRSQNIKQTFFEVGVFAGWQTNYFLKCLKKNRNFKFSPLLLEYFKSFDIDNQEDWNIVKKVYKYNLHNHA